MWNSEEDSQDVQYFFSQDSQEAAEMWAEMDDMDSAEYSIARGTSVIVCVRREPGDGTVTLYKVSGEYEPIYHARAVE